MEKEFKSLSLEFQEIRDKYSNCELTEEMLLFMGLVDRKVKEFIKLLKKAINRFDQNEMTNLSEILDKLVGDKLNGI